MYKFDNCNENIEKSILYELEIKSIKQVFGATSQCLN